MTAAVERIVDQVKKLDRAEREELLDWLSDQESDEMDDWDREIERDSRPGGRLEAVTQRVRRHIAEGKTRPLDDVLDGTHDEYLRLIAGA
jgi:hypothetical protein